MDPSVAREIAAIGDVLGPDQLASRAVYEGAHAQPPYDGVRVTRDVPYGPAERHRLDVFAGPDDGARPVVAFVHGGAFVGGDKAIAGSPYHDNVGLWACRAGLLGVTMNHRLAPDHR